MRCCPARPRFQNCRKNCGKKQSDTQASSRAATPGRSLPSKSSKEAPPPVLQCDTLSTVLYFLQAVAVSPPPITEMAPASVTSTILSIILLVPASKGAISKTPIGPFQTMVLDLAMAASFSSMDLGPIQAQEALRHSAAQITIRDLSVVAEFGGTHEVHREDQLDTLLFSLLFDLRHKLSTLLIVERSTDLAAIYLEEGECHATSDDHDVDLVQQVHDELDLVCY